MSGTRFIKVILPLRLEWEPVYSLPSETPRESKENTENEDIIPRVGTRVSVPFAGKDYIGVVSDADAEAEAKKIGPAKIKAINGVSRGLEAVSADEISLWRKMAEYYLCTVGEVYKAAYPSGKIAEEEAMARKEEAMARREARERERVRAKAGKLEERLAKKEEALAKARTEKTKAEYATAVDNIKKALRELMESPAGAMASSEPNDESTPGTGSSANDDTNRETPPGNSFEMKGARETAITLTPAQEEAYSGITKVFESGKPALLRGVTGSGKTEIYLKLAQETLAKGRNVLYMVPEIALSRQLEERVSKVFPGVLRVFHSGETMAQRRDSAAFIRRGKYAALGTRSSIFLPHNNLGLIIIDEEHDTSYKQDNPAPRYNGREAAIMLAGIFKANVILGSATPSLESLYNCSAGRFGKVELSERYYDSPDSEVEIIDTIAERRKNGMVGFFSRKLIDRVNSCLAGGGQAILLRERRAYSPVVQCEDCGEIPSCERCSVKLALHKGKDGSEKLVCHYCGRVYPYTGRCPKCGGALKPLGAGTQRIEEEARALFPNARIERLDSDSAAKEALTIKEFSKGNIDILIGTRVVAKGFDFSGLTLVAVLQAESILGQEDFRADERGSQLLEQFRGRCGRRGEKGLFVIQTSRPDHPVYREILGAMPSAELTESLLLERKLFGYPPYSRIIGIVMKDYNLERLEKLSRDLAETLRSGGVMEPTAGVIGPYAPAVDKISNQYVRHVRVLLRKDKSLSSNKLALASAAARFERERKYTGHISLDVDPA